ncbi:hypothetical protein K9M79_00025 [Candidatus Woesearchaeota archaeon]|nr:hypothetical protein [Candidatus Woesearchaeota archaeon]
MRRRKTSSDKKKKLMTTFFTAFIALIMITSIVGFMYTDSQQKMKIGNFSFFREGNFWILDDMKIPFRYLPEQVQEYNISDDAVDRMKTSNMVQITFDTSNLSIVEIRDIAEVGFSMSEILTEQMTIYAPPPAIASEDSRFPNSTIITCANSSMFVPVLSIEIGEEPEVTVSEGCILMKAKTTNQLTALKEAFLYRIIGIQWQE